MTACGDHRKLELTGRIGQGAIAAIQNDLDIGDSALTGLLLAVVVGIHVDDAAHRPAAARAAPFPFPAMNRYPVWKYIIILITLVVGVLYVITGKPRHQPEKRVKARLT